MSFSGPVLAIVILAAAAVLVIVRFEQFCLRDLAGRDERDLNYLSRSGWTIVISVVIPIGALTYLAVGRRR